MELYLQNLHCSNCAAKIEEKLNHLPGIHSAKINFVEKKIRVTPSGQNDETPDADAIFHDICHAVNLIEPNIIVAMEEDIPESHLHSHSENTHASFAIVGALILFLASFFIKEHFSIMLGLLVISYFLVGFHVLQTAVKNIFKGNVFDENFLMTIASIGAFAIGQYSEAVAVMLFYTIGEYLQNLAVDKSGRSIKALIKLQPEFANLVDLSGIKRVSPKTLAVGDKIKILPGEKVPVDAVIISGTSTLDTANITGESIPIDVSKNDSVISGMINKTGVLICEVKKTYQDSTVNQIMELVEKAGYKKSITENLITQFAKYYTPVVVFIAISLPLTVPFMTGDSFQIWMHRSLVFLVISCPCAMVISIPLSYFAGIGKSSSYGILAKGSNFIESMAKADTIVFDKTGTLTRGKFHVEKIITEPGVEENFILSHAGALEENSNHPVALSIFNHCKKSLPENFYTDMEKELTDISEIPGKGIRARKNESEVLLGNQNFMAENDIFVPDVDVQGTLVYLAVDKEYKGAVHVVDQIRMDAKMTMESLKKNGIKNIYMLTGDKDFSAGRISETLELSGYKSELLPQDKVAELESIMKGTNKNVVFVGDGTNDAPALAMADVGIAMAELGSAAAVESSDVTIMSQELKTVDIFYRIAKKTRKVAIQNIVFSLMVKIIIMILGVAGIANMWMAVFGDVGVSLLAILNALTVMMVKYDQKKPAAT